METRSLGRWAVVAGASEGLGRAFAQQLAARGHDLVLLARREALLAEVADELRAGHGVQVETLVVDLAQRGLAEVLAPLADREIGVLVYNAAYAPVGPLLEQPLERLEQVVDVNVRGLLTTVRTLGPSMQARGRGGIVMMASLAGLQGTPRLATYAATKAFTIALGEALWHELDPVQVVVSIAGAVRTPGYRDASEQEAPGTLDATQVARQSLDALGRGPRVIPGWTNRAASTVMRWLGRRRAVRLMADQTAKLAATPLPQESHR